MKTEDIPDEAMTTVEEDDGPVLDTSPEFNQEPQYLTIPTPEQARESITEEIQAIENVFDSINNLSRGGQRRVLQYVVSFVNNISGDI